MNKKISEKGKEKLSEWRILKNVNEMLTELQKDPSDEAYRQRIMLTAAVLCLRYGDPVVADTRYVREEAIKLKRNIMIEAKTNLTVPSRKKK